MHVQPIVRTTRRAARLGSLGRRMWVGALAALLATAVAVEASAEWRVIRTPLVEVIHESADEAAARHVATIAPEVFARAVPFAGWMPDEPVPVVIRGGTVEANGYYSPWPPHISLFVSPPTGLWLGAATADWLELVFTHELVHYLHLLQPIGLFGSISPIFGPLTTTVPLLFMPGWAIEGPTVTAETLFTTGGRGRNAFFEMQWVAPLLERRMWTLDEAAYSPPFAPSGRIYVGGYLYVDYLTRRFGLDAFATINRSFQQLPFLGMRPAVWVATGQRADVLYGDMVADLLDRYEDRLRLPQGRLASPPGAGNWYLPMATDRGPVTWARTNAGGGALHLLTAAGWEMIVAAEPADELSWTVSRDGRTAIVAVREDDLTSAAGGSAAWRSTSDLWRLDLEANARPQRLTVGRRLLHPALAPDGRLYAIERRGATTALVEVTNEGAIVDVYAAEDALIRTPAVSADGSRIAVTVSRDGQQWVDILEVGGARAAAGAEVAAGAEPGAEHSVDTRVRWLRRITAAGALHLPRFVVTEDGERLWAGLERWEVDATQPPPVTVVDFGAAVEVSQPVAHEATGVSAATHQTVVVDPVGAWGAIPYDGQILYASYRSDGFTLRYADDGNATVGHGTAPAAASRGAAPLPARAAAPGGSELPPAPPDLSAAIHPYRDSLRTGLILPLVSGLIATTPGASRIDAGAVWAAASTLGRHTLQLSALVDASGRLPTFDASWQWLPGASTFTVSSGIESAFASGGTIATARLRADWQRPLVYRRLPDGYRGLVVGAGLDAVGSAGRAGEQSAFLLPAALAAAGSTAEVVSSAGAVGVRSALRLLSRTGGAVNDPGSAPGGDIALRGWSDITDGARVSVGGALEARSSRALGTRRLHGEALTAVAADSDGAAAAALSGSRAARPATDATTPGTVAGAAIPVAGEAIIGVRYGIGPFDLAWRGWSLSDLAVAASIAQRSRWADGIGLEIERAFLASASTEVGLRFQRLEVVVEARVDAVVPHDGSVPSWAVSFGFSTPVDAVVSGHNRQVLPELRIDGLVTGRTEAEVSQQLERE